MLLRYGGMGGRLKERDGIGGLVSVHTGSRPMGLGSDFAFRIEIIRVKCVGKVTRYVDEQ